MNVLANLRRMAPALLLILAGGCATSSSDLITKVPVPIPLVPFSLPVPNLFFFLSSDVDLSRETWTEAFSEMHTRLMREYPYGEWKAVDWTSLEAEFGPRVAAAESAGDIDEFYLTLREYLYAIPDAHLGISENDALRAGSIGGGFGFAAVSLSDGRVLAQQVAPGSAAEEAGMQAGAELLSWNGSPLAEVLAATPILWESEPVSNDRSGHLARLRMLLRAPVGETVNVGWRNPGEDTQYTASLSATVDDFETLHQMRPFEVMLAETDTPLEARVLAGGAGYLRLKAISPTLEMPFLERAFQERLQQMLTHGVDGLILDLRGNTGGVDHLVPLLAGHFYETEGFYEDVASLNSWTDTFTPVAKLRLTVSPRVPHFQGPVVVLVDNSTMGPAEGLAMLIQRLPQGQVAGFETTRGSVGLTGGSLILPEGISIYYPTGRSLDEAGNIQLESNAAGEGGVLPDVLLPMDAETAQRLYELREDVLLEAAVAALGEAP